MSGMKEEERQEAQAMTLMSGLHPHVKFIHHFLFERELIDQFLGEKFETALDVLCQAMQVRLDRHVWDERGRASRSSGNDLDVGLAWPPGRPENGVGSRMMTVSETEDFMFRTSGEDPLADSCLG
jgi:hypothetical protein